MSTQPRCPCGRIRPVGRSLCWHCTNLKKRYGLTDLQLQSQWQTCPLCLKSVRYLAEVFKDTKGCAKCKVAVEQLSSYGTRWRINQLFDRKPPVDRPQTSESKP